MLVHPREAENCCVQSPHNSKPPFSISSSSCLSVCICRCPPRGVCRIEGKWCWSENEADWRDVCLYVFCSQSDELYFSYFQVKRCQRTDRAWLKSECSHGISCNESQIGSTTAVPKYSVFTMMLKMHVHELGISQIKGGKHLKTKDWRHRCMFCILMMPLMLKCRKLTAALSSKPLLAHWTRAVLSSPVFVWRCVCNVGETERKVRSRKWQR